MSPKAAASGGGIPKGSVSRIVTCSTLDEMEEGNNISDGMCICGNGAGYKQL